MAQNNSGYQPPEGWRESLHRAECEFNRPSTNEPHPLKPWQWVVIVVLLLIVTAAVCGLWVAFRVEVIP